MWPAEAGAETSHDPSNVPVVLYYDERAVIQFPKWVVSFGLVAIVQGRAASVAAKYKASCLARGGMPNSVSPVPP